MEIPELAEPETMKQNTIAQTLSQEKDGFKV